MLFNLFKKAVKATLHAATGEWTLACGIADSSLKVANHSRREEELSCPSPS
jgi:hypothetical protein